MAFINKPTNTVYNMTVFNTNYTNYMHQGITFYAGSGSEIHIKTNGDIECIGSFTKNAMHFLDQVRSHIDLKAAKVTSLQRYYIKGMEHSLMLAKKLSKEELIEHLEKEISIRKGNETFDILSDNHGDSE